MPQAKEAAEETAKTCGAPAWDEVHDSEATFEKFETPEEGDDEDVDGTMDDDASKLLSIAFADLSFASN